MKTEGASATDNRLGRFIKAQRESLDMGQRHLAKELGYRNINFISMIETGTSKIPLNKIPRFVNALRLPPVFMGIIMREIYPECWQTFLEMTRAIPDMSAVAGLGGMKKELDAIYKSSLEEFRID